LKISFCFNGLKINDLFSKKGDISKILLFQFLNFKSKEWPQLYLASFTKCIFSYLISKGLIVFGVFISCAVFQASKISSLYKFAQDITNFSIFFGKFHSNIFNSFIEI
jgi:hypothetical protein